LDPNLGRDDAQHSLKDGLNVQRVTFNSKCLLGYEPCDFRRKAFYLARPPTPILTLPLKGGEQGGGAVGGHNEEAQ